MGGANENGEMEMSETLEQTIARIKSKWPEHWGLPRVEKAVTDPKEAKITPLEAIPEPRGKMKDSLDMEGPDFKLRAAGEDDGWDSVESVEYHGGENE